MTAPEPTFRVGVNRQRPGQKLPQGDTGHAAFHGAFKPETHSPRSLLDAVMQGYAVCPELMTGDCGREHHGRRWCCKDRRDSGDPTHCGRPAGYRIRHHFKSGQYLALDYDAGNPSLEDLLSDNFIASYASFIYSTISSTPDDQKWRVLFTLPEPITDPDIFRKAQTALLGRYSTTDQSIKDPARLLYGSNPVTGVSHFLGNVLPMTQVLKLVVDYEEAHWVAEREVERSRSGNTRPRISMNSGDQRYISKVIQKEIEWLATRAKGTGERHIGLLLVARRLESLRLSSWLSPEARAGINTYDLVMSSARANGYLDEYGEVDARRAIAWGIGVAEPRPAPTDRGARRSASPYPLAEYPGISQRVFQPAPPVTFPRAILMLLTPPMNFLRQRISQLFRPIIQRNLLPIKGTSQLGEPGSDIKE